MFISVSAGNIVVIIEVIAKSFNYYEKKKVQVIGAKISPAAASELEKKKSFGIDV